jgi:hypothetical protein
MIRKNNSVPETASAFDVTLDIPAPIISALEDAELDEMFGGPSVSAVPQPNANGEFATPADGAKFMASFGIPQIPLRGKDPSVNGKGWQDKGSTDFVQIDRWAKQYPGCNFGSIAKAVIGGFYALETDSPAPHAEFQKETGGRFDAKLLTKSGEGRAHWWLRHTSESIALGNIGQLGGDGFSLRLHNEQCVSPGSIHPERKTQYANILNGAPEPASDKLIAWLKSKKKNAKIEEPKRDENGKIPFGMIHNFLLTELGRLRGRGYSIEGAEAALLAFSEEQCEVHDPDHIHQMVMSTGNWKTGNPMEGVVLSGGKLAGSNPASTQSESVTEGFDEKKSKYVRAITIEEYTKMVDITRLYHPLDEGSKKIVIPPFDPFVMTGLAKDMTELLVRGTTLLPQFVYGIAKTVITARMAGNVILEGVSAEPTRYFTTIGETGTGKGEAWRRMLQILHPEGVIDANACGIKIINSTDSGAGLKDFFFDFPENNPVLCYIDEIASLGNKSTEKKQPEILDTIIELADSTTFSRVLASRKGQSQTRTKTGAHLVIVSCGQDGKVYGQAFGSREKQGIFDRLTPEYGEPVEAGDMPIIEPLEAYEMLQRFNSLPYKAVVGQEAIGADFDSGKIKTAPKFMKQRMTMRPDAKEVLHTFWKEQPKPVRDKARFRKNLMLDAYVNAFMNIRLAVETEDMTRAINTFLRELAIRSVHFNTPIGDRVSYYSALIKEITVDMIEKLVRGEHPKIVAQTKRDYLTKTNAYRNNEEHIFYRAWISHEKDYLIPIKVPSSNGRFYEKYLPAPCD